MSIVQSVRIPLHLTPGEDYQRRLVHVMDMSKLNPQGFRQGGNAERKGRLPTMAEKYAIKAGLLTDWQPRESSKRGRAKRRARKIFIQEQKELKAKAHERSNN